MQSVSSRQVAVLALVVIAVLSFVIVQQHADVMQGLRSLSGHVGGESLKSALDLAGLVPQGRLTQERPPVGHPRPPVAADVRTKPSPLLAGTPRNTQGFMTLGIPTMKRSKGDYFLATLTSLLKETSPEQQEEITFVVMLGDRDQKSKNDTLQQIKTHFQPQLNSGLVLVVDSPNSSHLFSTDDLKRTYGDDLKRVRWRSKQNLDYAQLMDFCAALPAIHYLQMEDDVLAVPNYYGIIKKFITSSNAKQWSGIRLYDVGFKAVIFKTCDLPKLASVLRMFYLEKPCDLLLGDFYSMMQDTKEISGPQHLFFHQGKHSSLTGVVRGVDGLPFAKKT